MAALRVTVVGCAPAYARGAGRASSCYLVETESRAIVLDLGQGSFAALAALRPPETLDAVFVSHLHPDHGIDLVPLRHYLRYACTPPARVALHAPADIRRRYDVLIGEADFLADLPGEPLESGEREVGPFRLTVARVTHTDSSFAVRVAASGAHGPGLVYSGDCGRAEDLVPLIRPGDVLLCEASFGPGPSPLEPGAPSIHLTGAEAAGAAAQGSASRLVLTHILDEVDAQATRAQAQRAFPGPVELAKPGLVVEIPAPR